MSNVLVTGGAGFIGANFVRYWRRVHPGDRIVALDALTYAGNPANLSPLRGDEAFHFVHGNICDGGLLKELFRDYAFETIVHFAAESHVDRSILSPEIFLRTNVLGTHTLLEVALVAWKSSFDGQRFLHVSTDEVYGSLAQHDEPFTETSRYDPKSPYAASKAASDFLVRSYAHTYGLPTLITNCSNNYGPYQFPEKLIPLVILNSLTGKPLPIYGDGLNVRDWIHVDVHCEALARILQRGRIGDTYNIGGGQEMTNIELVELMCAEIDRRFSTDANLAGRFADCPAARGGHCRELISFVKDRPGHDRRYAICADKLVRELGALEHTPLREGLSRTLDWYIANEGWWRDIQSGAYLKGIDLQYGENAIARRGDASVLRT